jgi:hypothetical protein
MASGSARMRSTVWRGCRLAFVKCARLRDTFRQSGEDVELLDDLRRVFDVPAGQREKLIDVICAGLGFRL